MNHDHDGEHDLDDHDSHAGHAHHAEMIRDFRRRFWGSLGATVPISTLAPGDRVCVKSSQTIPADGTIANGRSNVNESMLTGDNEHMANGVAEELGLDRVIAEVLPDEKSRGIEKLQAEGKLMTMTG